MNGLEAMDVYAMEKISPANENFWIAAPSENKREIGAAQEFSQVLESMKNPSANNTDKSAQDETKSVIQRSVITGASGEQIIVFTLVTMDDNGKIIDSKVISKQKVGNDTPDDSQQDPIKNGNRKAVPDSEEKNTPYSTVERARKEYEYSGTIDSHQMNDLLNAQG